MSSKDIKKENKDKIKVVVLADNPDDKSELENSKTHLKNIECEIIYHPNGHNYMSKINKTKNCDTPYLAKWDEDVFVPCHVWDYMIENLNVLESSEVMQIMPTMSTTIPCVDLFIEDFVTDLKIKEKLNNIFLDRPLPKGLWGVDYEPLNEATINSTKWSPKKYYDILRNLGTNLMGMHPMRISWEGHFLLNDYITTNFNRLMSKHSYSFTELDEPYFNNNLFIIKSDRWTEITGMIRDAYDEVTQNIYRNNNKLKVLYVKNGFSIHTMFNTIHGAGNPWNIGNESSQEKENLFFEEIIKKLEI